MGSWSGPAKHLGMPAILGRHRSPLVAALESAATKVVSQFCPTQMARSPRSAKAGRKRTAPETVGRTGVEMEALTAVQVGLLTVYDMVKAIDRGMVMEGIRVLEKHGGKSGSWTHP
jgi:hypothetical protein